MCICMYLPVASLRGTVSLPNPVKKSVRQKFELKQTPHTAVAW
jgi:hypothetical protein